MIKLRRDDLLIVGVTAENIMNLVEDKPLLIDLEEVQGGAKLVVVVYKQTFAGLIDHFVETGLMPRHIADQVRDPQPGEKRVVRPD